MPSIQERIAAIRAAREVTKKKDQERAEARASMQRARAPRPPKAKAKTTVKPAVSKAAETKAAAKADVKEA